MTRIELDLLHDLDMYVFLETGIRGGISVVSKRFAPASNKYMSTYDKDKPSSYLSYLDANNLYGWSMSQPLPVSDFKWKRDGLTVDEIANYDSTSDIGLENNFFDSLKIIR